MRAIKTISAGNDWTLDIFFADGARRLFDMKPLLEYEVFVPLRNIEMFRAISNGGYFVEWPNEADLSADTLYLEGKQVC
jgi:hypothetical protein